MIKSKKISFFLKKVLTFSFLCGIVKYKVRNEEKEMINYITQHEYTGKNFDTLCAAGYDEGDAFVTFKQAIKLDGISGKKLAGIKKAATLVRFSKTQKELDENGKMVSKPIYFSVFDVKEVLKRRAA